MRLMSRHHGGREQNETFLQALISHQSETTSLGVGGHHVHNAVRQACLTHQEWHR